MIYAMDIVARAQTIPPDSGEEFSSIAASLEMHAHESPTLGLAALFQAAMEAAAAQGRQQGIDETKASARMWPEVK